MTFADGLWLALARAASAALLTTLLATAIVRVLRAPSGGAPSRQGGAAPAPSTSTPSAPTPLTARLLRACLLLIWLTPTLLIGYAYSDGPFSLARHALWNELLYSWLLALKLLPVAVAVLYFAPAPPLSREAAFLLKLAPRSSGLKTHAWRQAIGFLLNGGARNPLIAFAAVLLLAFQDFELAALMNVASGRAHSAYTWTIALHEARQLSAPTGAILSRVAWAVAVQLAVLAAAAALVWRTRHGTGEPQAPIKHVSTTTRAIAWVSTLAALSAIVLLPGYTLLHGLIDGLGELLANFRFGEELLASLYFAAGATVIVMVSLTWLRAPRRLGASRLRGAPRRKAGAGPYNDGQPDRSDGVRPAVDRHTPMRLETTGDRASTALPGRCSRFIIAALALPGLLGALTLGMLLMALFQLPWLRGLYDTPIPLVMGLALLVLPIALLIQLVLRSNEPGEAIHLASLLRASNDASQRSSGGALLWSLRGRPVFLLAAFVFFFCYLELVVSVTLAPIAMTPAIVELYNQMHYGQRALLSALMAVTVATPVAIAAVGWVALQLLSLRERTASKRRAAAF